jgi:hypothetical protein
MIAPNVLDIISMTSNVPRNVKDCRTSKKVITNINNVMNFLKRVRYSNGIMIPKGIKAAMFPKSYNQDIVSFGNLRRIPSGTNINVY